MINRLVKLATDFSTRYKLEGLKILTECHQQPEFKSLLEHVKTIDTKILGIETNNFKSYFQQSSISYFNILEDKDISIGVFCLAKGAALKLHDHPNMLVVSKILHGSVHSRSMDLEDRSVQLKFPKMLFEDDDPAVVGTKLDATVAFDGLLKKDDISILSPLYKNIHSFKALEDTAILDILVPNYDDENRFCNFYLEVDDDNEEVKIEEIIQNHSDTKSNGLYINGVKSNGNMDTEPPKSKFKSPGEKTTIMFILPPFDMHVKLLDYEGEKFDSTLEL